ncbi:uncharacterized protein LOC134681988 [Mytilus trossulus]|uniref:uncharacterized protein LOC134681988 n=1 Tax=Mytilus trossulus TaxID=6551 RepID=UPI0030052F95
MKEQYFDNIKEWSPDYVVLGKIMALSLLQNGKLPKVLSADLVEEVFKSDSMRPCVKDLRKGLDSLGIYQLSITLPMVVHLFTPGPQQHMKFRQLTSILTPQFSPEGSNRRKRESAIYSLFVKYIREAASGRRGMVDLRCILRFATGTEEEPALGYSIDPSIQFVEGTSFMPTANTCINKMNLTIPDSNEVSVGKDFLFNLFDYAFSNTFFGMK